LITHLLDDDDDEVHFPLKIEEVSSLQRGLEQRPGLIGLVLSYECAHFHAFQVIIHRPCVHDVYSAHRPIYLFFIFLNACK